MKNSIQTTIFFIAAFALSTGAIGQKVYRCGSSYSQIPCADGVAVEAQDPRSKIQKSQADAATKNDAAMANAMEKTRLNQEADALKNSKPVVGKPPPKPVGPAASPAEPDNGAKKAAAKHKKEPEYFTAQVAAEKKKKPVSAPQ